MVFKSICTLPRLQPIGGNRCSRAEALLPGGIFKESGISEAIGPNRSMRESMRRGKVSHSFEPFGFTARAELILTLASPRFLNSSTHST